MSEQVSIPDPALVVLVGASGSGKSTWARERYSAQEIVSSDDLRAVVGAGPHDLEATSDAFAILDQIVAARARRRLTVVVDSLGLDAGHRGRCRAVARDAGMPAVAVLVDTDARTCRLRNAGRDRPVPAAALAGQLRRMGTARSEIDLEGWDLVIAAESASMPETSHNKGFRDAASAQQQRPAQLGFVLQIARFPWGDDPGGWLVDVATAAADVGFEGVALMDHLIQIPQVDRAWEPIPEPWVTLGMLAGRVHRLRLGTLVSPVTFRAAGVMAKTVATLDALSGGRAFCGVGAGWWEREHRAFGLPFPPARRRFDDLEATIETMRALWSPGTRPYAGGLVELPETTCYPRPARAIEVIVGGSGERRTLRIAARLADACNLPSTSLDTLQHKIGVLHRHCDEVGRAREEVAITVLDVPIIGADREAVAAKVERLRGTRPAESFARRHHAGTMDDHLGRYRLLADHGVSTVFVSLPDLAGPDDLQVMAPLVEAFAAAKTPGH